METARHGAHSARRWNFWPGLIAGLWVRGHRWGKAPAAAAAWESEMSQFGQGWLHHITTNTERGLHVHRTKHYEFLSNSHDGEHKRTFLLSSPKRRILVWTRKYDEGGHAKTVDNRPRMSRQGSELCQWLNASMKADSPYAWDEDNGLQSWAKNQVWGDETRNGSLLIRYEASNCNDVTWLTKWGLLHLHESWKNNHIALPPV